MKNASPFEYAELINVFANGLPNDLFTKEDVTRWADGFISRDEQPDIFFIELSLSHTKAEALALLNETARNMATETNFRPLLSALYRKLLSKENSLIDTASSLWTYEWSEELLTGHECYFMDSLAYAAETSDLASSTNYQQLEQDTKQFLSIYQDYTVENYAKWAALDQEINQKLDVLWLTQENKIATKAQPLWWQFWKS